jgi:hypothetical protein
MKLSSSLNSHTYAKNEQNRFTCECPASISKKCMPSGQMIPLHGTDVGHILHEGVEIIPNTVVMTLFNSIINSSIY